jgi:preprotein translocase subunit SecG
VAGRASPVKYCYRSNGFAIISQGKRRISGGRHPESIVKKILAKLKTIFFIFLYCLLLLHTPF